MVGTLGACMCAAMVTPSLSPLVGPEDEDGLRHNPHEVIYQLETTGQRHALADQ